MEMSNARLVQLVTKLISSIDDNCYEHSDKLNIIHDSGITAAELKLLGFDYMNDWFEDANTDPWDEDGWHDDIPSAEDGDYSPSHPWDAPGMSIKDFI